MILAPRRTRTSRPGCVLPADKENNTSSQIWAWFFRPGEQRSFHSKVLTPACNLAADEFTESEKEWFDGAISSAPAEYNYKLFRRHTYWPFSNRNSSILRKRAQQDYMLWASMTWYQRTGIHLDLPSQFQHLWPPTYARQNGRLHGASLSSCERALWGSLKLSPIKPASVHNKLLTVQVWLTAEQITQPDTAIWLVGTAPLYHGFITCTVGKLMCHGYRLLQEEYHPIGDPPNNIEENVWLPLTQSCANWGCPGSPCLHQGHTLKTMGREVQCVWGDDTC